MPFMLYTIWLMFKLLSLPSVDKKYNFVWILHMWGGTPAITQQKKRDRAFWESGIQISNAHTTIVKYNPTFYLCWGVYSHYGSQALQ